MARFGRLVKANLGKRVVDLRNLPWGLRLLAVLGYASVALMLAATLFLDLSGNRLQGVEFQSEALSATMRVPVLALVFSSLSLALGWTFVLTGASDCRRRVFLPVAALFLVQWVLFAPAEGALAPLIGLGGMLLIGAVAWAHSFSRRSVLWSNLPLIEFAAWLALMLVAVAGLFLGET